MGVMIMVSCERGGDSGILSLLRVSLRARRLGRSGGEIGVNIGAESKAEAGGELVDIVFSGVRISGLDIVQSREVVDVFGRTIEYRKCL